MADITGTLEDWITIKTGNYTPFEQRKVVGVTGYVYGHKIIKDGTLITTSPLIKFDFKLKLLYTTNSIYRLGKILE